MDPRCDHVCEAQFLVMSWWDMQMMTAVCGQHLYSSSRDLLL